MKLLYDPARRFGPEVALMIMACIALPLIAHGQPPSGFHWVDMESDTATMTKVRAALKGHPITAIREVGIQGDTALVMAVSREADAPTPDYDLWFIYSLSLPSGKLRILVSGYGVKLINWLGSDKGELAITYYDCWECEAATFFTTLHYVHGEGWKARWPDPPSDWPHPGVAVESSDAGEEAEQTDVVQVFALVPGIEDRLEGASWFHAKDYDKKIEDRVTHFWVDASTGRDKLEELTGNSALQWKRRICRNSELLSAPAIGQDSKGCKAILALKAH